jgi:hypothetical protein
MRGNLFPFGLVTVSLFLGSAIGAAQEKKDTPQARGQFALPGEVHKQLAKQVGEYTTHSKMMLKPGAPGEETTGTSRIIAVLGGRFLQQEDAGTMLGQPFTSIHLDGYDNATKKYQANWVYTGSTGMMSLTGTSKDGGKTIEYAATFENEQGTKETMTVTTRIIDDDHFVIELTAKTPDGGKGPTLETTYTRKK